MTDGSLMSWTWFGLAFLLFGVEALRPGRFALWLGFAAILVGVMASVARWPWPTEVAALAVFAAAFIPAWRRYQRLGQPPQAQSTSR
jgi:membrane protein implicated in regulation of membrane protease activity